MFSVAVSSFVTTNDWPNDSVDIDIYKVKDAADGACYFYLPVRQVAPALGQKFQTVNAKIGNKTPQDHLDALLSFLRSRIGGVRGKPTSNYVSLPVLKEYLLHRKAMSEEVAESIMEEIRSLVFLTNSATIPHKKRTREEEEEEEEELPAFMVRFLEEVDSRIGAQAIVAYQASKEFNDRVAAMFEEMEAEVRKQVEKEFADKRKQLEEQLEEETRANFENRIKPQFLKELQTRTIQLITTDVIDPKQLVQTFALNRKEK